MSNGQETDPASPAALRARAQWYRDFAKLGSEADRPWRLQLADHFERLADERERAALRDVESKDATPT